MGTRSLSPIPRAFGAPPLPRGAPHRVDTSNAGHWPRHSSLRAVAPTICTANRGPCSFSSPARCRAPGVRLVCAAVPCKRPPLRSLTRRTRLALRAGFAVRALRSGVSPLPRGFPPDESDSAGRWPALPCLLVSIHRCCVSLSRLVARQWMLTGPVHRGFPCCTCGASRSPRDDGPSSGRPQRGAAPLYRRPGHRSPCSAGQRPAGLSW